MAASSADDIPTQLAVLLGRQTVHIRKTDEDPPRISIIDVIAVVTGKDKNQAAEDLRRLTARHPDVKANCFVVSVDFGCQGFMLRSCKLGSTLSGLGSKI